VEQVREYEQLNQRELKEDNWHNDWFAIIHKDLKNEIIEEENKESENDLPVPRMTSVG
jgi:hypothetical protein